MSQVIRDENNDDSSSPTTGDQLATRVFTLTMIGVIAVIIMMVILGDY